MCVCVCVREREREGNVVSLAKLGAFWPTPTKTLICFHSASTFPLILWLKSRPDKVSLTKLWKWEICRKVSWLILKWIFRFSLKRKTLKKPGLLSWFWILKIDFEFQSGVNAFDEFGQVWLEESLISIKANSNFPSF